MESEWSMTFNDYFYSIWSSIGRKEPIGNTIYFHKCSSNGYKNYKNYNFHMLNCILVRRVDDGFMCGLWRWLTEMSDVFVFRMPSSSILKFFFLNWFEVEFLWLFKELHVINQLCWTLRDLWEWELKWPS